MVRAHLFSQKIEDCVSRKLKILQQIPVKQTTTRSFLISQPTLYKFGPFKELLIIIINIDDRIPLFP